MDATGLNALEDLYEKLHRKGKHLVLSAPHTNPRMVMEEAGFSERLGRKNVCPQPGWRAYTPAIRRLYSARAVSRRSLAVVSPGTLWEG